MSEPAAPTPPVAPTPAPTSTPAVQMPLKTTMHISLPQLLSGALLLAAALCVAQYVRDTLAFEHTDDASVEGRHTLLSPKVPGIVVKVHFDDNRAVKAGEALVELDPRDYENALGVLRAEFAAVQANLKDASIKYHEAQALLKSGAITSQRKDTDEARYFALQADAQRLQKRMEQSKVDLEYATLRAPGDGTVGRRAVEPGMYAHTGQALISFVSAHDRWIVANFKETQLAHMQVGSHAQVRVDAIGERVFEGTVESISPTSGAVFSLLPPDNATGNYIKIVQRVPVKILLKQLSDEDIAALQVGLNADVRILRR